MRFMIIRRADAQTEAGVLPTEAQLAAMSDYNEQMVKAGVFLGGDGLKPSRDGARVSFRGGKPTVTDGPFAETKELIAGFWLWQVKSMEEAMEWVKRCPNPMESDSDIEIRQVYEMEDFGEAFTPELREQESRLREQVERKM